MTNPSLITHNSLHSVLRLLTGFAKAAFTAWKLMVIMAINIAAKPTKIKVCQLIDMRYSKSINHLFMMYQLIEVANVIAMPHSLTTAFYEM